MSQDKPCQSVRNRDTLHTFMAAITKPEQIRLRVSPEHKRVIHDLAGAILTDADVASMLIEAAIEAVKRSGGQFTYPLRLEVANLPAVALFNEPNESPRPTPTPAPPRR